MLTDRTPVEEYHARWRRAQAVCRENGVEALVVWSRGGGTLDTSDDVVYLANHYAVFPYLNDLPGEWSGLSSTAVVLPVDGEPTLCVDTPPIRADSVPVDDVRVSELLPDLVGKVLAERGLSSARVGLVAGNALLLAPYRRLLEACPKVDFVPMDNAVDQLRARKSPYEFELLREVAVIGSEAMTAMMTSATRPGSRESDAVRAAYDHVISNGGAPYDAAVASGPHSEYFAYGQVPQWTTRELESGDIFHCDMYGAAVEGYRYDLSRTTFVGGRPTSAQEEVLDGAIASIRAGIAVLRPGVLASEVFRAVQGVLDERGIDVGYPIHGHSFGLGWEGPWITPGQDVPIEAGMAIAVETMAGRPGVGSVKFEENVLVHEDRVELLTTTPEKPWLL